MLCQALHQMAKYGRQIELGMIQNSGQALGDVTHPLGQDDAVFAQQSTDLIGLSCTRFDKALPCRCRESTACCSTFLIGTKRMFGLPTASQTALASAASFLFVLTYGFTN